MRNPLVHEDAAFRLVLGTIAYFAPIVIASWIAPWLGLIVFALATVVVVVMLWRGRRRSQPPPVEPARAQVTDTDVSDDARR